MEASILLHKIQSMYFTDTDEIRHDIPLNFEDIFNLKSELLQVELREGFNAQTEAIDSFIDELIMNFGYQNLKLTTLNSKPKVAQDQISIVCS